MGGERRSSVLFPVICFHLFPPIFYQSSTRSVIWLSSHGFSVLINLPICGTLEGDNLQNNLLIIVWYVDCRFSLHNLICKCFIVRILMFSTYYATFLSSNVILIFLIWIQIYVSTLFDDLSVLTGRKIFWNEMFEKTCEVVT